MHQFANYTTNTHCSKGFNPGTCCLLINFIIHGYFTHIIVMYYLYAERYENIHDKSLMENIFGIWSIQGSVQGRFCSICTTFDQSLGRSSIKHFSLTYGLQSNRKKQINWGKWADPSSKPTVRKGL